MRHFTKEEIAKLSRKKEVSGLGDMWHMHLGGLHTMVRVLPPDLYAQVTAGKALPPGANVPGPPPVKDKHVHKH